MLAANALFISVYTNFVSFICCGGCGRFLDFIEDVVFINF